MLIFKQNFEIFQQPLLEFDGLMNILVVYVCVEAVAIVWHADEKLFVYRLTLEFDWDIKLIRTAHTDL